MSTNLNFVRYPIKGKTGEVFLTQREISCLLHLLKGKTAKQIARDLFISHRTVEDHFSNIRKKVGCWSRSQLIAYILESNFLQLIIKLGSVPEEELTLMLMLQSS
jgi:DNA-binding NarL/FixJ family response regulator